MADMTDVLAREGQLRPRVPLRRTTPLVSRWLIGPPKNIALILNAAVRISAARQRSWGPECRLGLFIVYQLERFLLVIVVAEKVGTTIGDLAIWCNIGSLFRSVGATLHPSTYAASAQQLRAASSKEGRARGNSRLQGSRHPPTAHGE